MPRRSPARPLAPLAFVLPLASFGAAASPLPDARTEFVQRLDLHGASLDASLRASRDAPAHPVRDGAAAAVELGSSLRWSATASGFGARLAVEDLAARVGAGPGADTRVELPLRDVGVLPLAAVAWRGAHAAVTAGRQPLGPLPGRLPGAVSSWQPSARAFDGIAVSFAPAPRADLRIVHATSTGAAWTLRDDGVRGGGFELVDARLDAGALGRLAGFAYRVDGGERAGTRTRVGGVEWRAAIPGAAPDGLALRLAHAGLDLRTAPDGARARLATTSAQLERGSAVLHVGRVQAEQAGHGAPPSSLHDEYARSALAALGADPARVARYAVLRRDEGDLGLSLGAFREADRPGARGATGWSTAMSHRVLPWVRVEARLAGRQGPESRGAPSFSLGVAGTLR